MLWLLPALAGQSFKIATVAGTDTLREGAAATTAMLRLPMSVAVDAAGNLYIADARANRVRKVSAAGIITTVAGDGVEEWYGDGGPATQASLDTPVSVAVDKNGNVYIAESGSNRVRKVSAATGVISTIAGNGSSGTSGDGGQAVNAGFSPYSLAVDPDGNVYIADWMNDRVRKVNVATGVITTVAGVGNTGYSGDNGPAASATLAGPSGIAIDPAGNVYICDQYNLVIRKVAAATGVITTIAGTGAPGDSGDNGPALSARFMLPDTIALDPAGTKLYISNLDRIRVIDLESNRITAFAGTGDMGFSGDSGPAGLAQFSIPMGIAVSAAGHVFIADTGNARIRRVRDGQIDSVAGTDAKDGGPATSAYLAEPESVAVAANGDLFITDTAHHRVRKVAASDGRISTIAGTGVGGVSSTQVAFPTAAVVDPEGNVVFSDFGGNRIQRVSPGGGGMTTIAGSPTGRAGASGDGGPSAAALLNGPSSLAYDRAGNLYIADMMNFRVRKVEAETGKIVTVAGTGQIGTAGVGGRAVDANVMPFGVAVDAAGNLYIADIANRVLKVDATTNLLSIVAGTGAAGYSGDGGPATAARLKVPAALAFDSAGNLYISDLGNLVIRRVNTAGVIHTVAGTGEPDLGTENGPALTTGLGAAGLSVNAAGEIFLADALHDRIRKLTPVVVAGFAGAGGNNQSGTPGQRITLTVTVTDSSGGPVQGVEVAFAVTSGSATLNPPRAISGADGRASTTVLLGIAPGAVVVAATTGGMPPVVFNLTVNPPVTVPQARISAGGVVGASLSLPAKRTLAVGGIGSIFGENFLSSGVTGRRVESGDLVNGKVPTTFLGVCVVVGPVRAPVFAAYPNQINFQVPDVAEGAAVPVRVVAGCGTASETTTNAENVVIQASAPEFFYARLKEDGCNPVVAVDAISGTILGGAELGGGFTPSKPKDVVTLYGTSFGRTGPWTAPGAFPDAIAPVTAQAKLTIGGREVPAANILYVGVAPFNPGLYQVNVILPDDLPDGDLPVVLTVGGSASPAGPYLTVRR